MSLCVLNKMLIFYFIQIQHLENYVPVLILCHKNFGYFFTQQHLLTLFEIYMELHETFILKGAVFYSSTNGLQVLNDMPNKLGILFIY